MIAYCDGVMGRVGAERRGVGGGRSRRDEKNKTVKTKNTMMDKNGIQKNNNKKDQSPYHGYLFIVFPISRCDVND